MQRERPEKRQGPTTKNRFTRSPLSIGLLTDLNLGRSSGTCQSTHPASVCNLLTFVCSPTAATWATCSNLLDLRAAVGCDLLFPGNLERISGKVLLVNDEICAASAPRGRNEQPSMPEPVHCAAD